MGIVQANGINIHVEERGQGEPLLLLMGLGADGPTWELHANAYSKHFRCLLVDNRGAGRSDKPEGPYTTEQMALDAIGVLDALGIEKTHVSGISMGGAIAQHVALLAPERIRSLTINCSWETCDHFAARIFGVLRSSVGVLDYSAFTRLLQLIIFSPDYHNHYVDDLLAREESGRSYPFQMPAQTFRAQCDACVSHDTRGRLSAIKAPTLITVGNKDMFTPLHLSEQIHNDITGSELAVFEGSGHVHHWEQLERFNELTLQFMLKHS